MEEQYYDDRNYRAGALREDMDEPLGEDGPTPDVADRGLFGRRHGHGSDYDAEYATSELAGRRPPIPYDGGYGDGYGGEYELQRPRPPPEVVYEGGYGGRPPMYAEPVEPTSDLGIGLMDSQIRTRPDNDTSGYGESDLTYAVDRGHHGKRHGYSKEDADEEIDDERKHKHYAEAAAAAAMGYGLYERHQKKDAEEKLEELGYDSDGKKKHDY